MPDTFSQRPPVIDACQYCNWSEAIFRELREGGVDAIHVTVSYHEDFRETVEKLIDWNRWFERCPELIMPGRVAADIDRARASGRTAVFFGLQNPSPIEDDIGLVAILHDLGIRFMQLTYNNQSLLGTGCYEKDDTGITRMGREVIAEMNRVGMVIDMSHSAERSTREAIDLSARPIAITHANPARWHPIARNKSDAVLQALAARGGMLGLSLYPHHLSGGSDCTLENFTAMVADLAGKIGVDHIGIGSDLCQGQPDSVVAWMRNGRWTKGVVDIGLGKAVFPPQPPWFRDNRDWHQLRAGLVARGFSAADTGKILGYNWYRFFAASFRRTSRRSHMTAPIVITAVEIETLARTALNKAGASAEQAAALARGIAAAERDGLSSHGLAYLATYCEHLACGKVRGQAVPKVAQASAGVVTVDAGSGFAHAAIDAGFKALIPLARQQGIASLAIRKSYNAGVLGHHTERLAREGLVALGFTNAPASIAASGGKRPVLGTNPWSLAVPDGRGGIAIAIDQSASTVAKSEVMKRARLGQAIPLGWALDADGQPTTDPAIGLRGSMAPSGGYKGVGTAILVEVMCACLAGAHLGVEASPFSGPAGGPPGTGQYFIAIDPVTSGGAFAGRTEALIAALTADPAVHVPGAGRRAARARTDRVGAKVDAAIYATCKALAG